MKNKRTESIWLDVTPEVKKEFDNCKDDKEMQEQIIREYITKEKDILKDYLSDFEKSELMYKCSLFKIKDSFKKARDEYADDITELYDSIYLKNKQLKESLASPEQQINELKRKIDEIKDVLSNLNIDSLIRKMESFISLIERFNNLSSEDKGIIKLLLDRQLK